MTTILFETERLRVQQFEMNDLNAFATLCADERVMRYVGDGEVLPRSEVARWIEVCQQKYRDRGYGTSAVFERTTDRFIGYCGVVRAPGNDFDELIYVYHIDTWGNGYATEAARAMLRYVFGISSLDRIYATIHADNAASIHVAHKLGFHFEHEEQEEDGSTTLFYVIERGALEA